MARRVVTGMRLAATLPAFVASCAALATAQPSAPQPHFDAATIKLAGPILSTIPERSPGRLHWFTQIAYLAGYAYGLDFSRVSGQQLGGAIYDVNAVFEPSATDDQLRLMLQSLLAERFKMRAHRVSTEADGFAITAAKGGIKLKESSAVAGSSSAGSYVSAHTPARGVIALSGNRASIAQLAATLGRVTATPMWDQTGLTGTYTFAFLFSQGLDTETPTDTPSLGTAMRDLGLSLQKQKGPVETLIIDSIEQPSDN